MRPQANRLAHPWGGLGIAPGVESLALGAIRVADSVTDLGGGWKVGAEDFLAAVLGATAQPIWVVDPDGQIRAELPLAAN